MPKWTVTFFPPSGERFAPEDYIVNLSDKSEKTQIIKRLESLRQLDIADWPHTWYHKLTGKIYQLTVGDNRLMYCLDEGKIVVLHVCRKVKKRTHKKDRKRAKIHYDRYMERKGER